MILSPQELMIFQSCNGYVSNDLKLPASLYVVLLHKSQTQLKTKG